jgi:uncharacterized protein (DUF1778 family)
MSSDPSPAFVGSTDLAEPGSLLVEDQRFALVPDRVLGAEVSDAAFRVYSLQLRLGNTSERSITSPPLLPNPPARVGHCDESSHPLTPTWLGLAMSGTSRQGSDRAHRSPRRSRAVLVRLDDEEYAAIAAAADQAGLTVAGYTAESALSHAHGCTTPTGDLRPTALKELIEARTQVRNQSNALRRALERAGSAGEGGLDISSLINTTNITVNRVDEAVAEIARSLRLDH